MESETLYENKYSDGTIKFSMRSVNVDGISGYRPDLVYDVSFLSYKSMEDPGEPFRWKPEFVPSEEHWLKEGHVAMQNEFCAKCGRYLT